jgi:hypothetical protein
MANLAFVKYCIKSVRSISGEEISASGAAVAMQDNRALAVE